MDSVRPDYRSVFTSPRRPADDRSAEQWARAVFEDAPAVLRPLLVSGWLGLGLRGNPRRSPRRVLGWSIVAADERSALLEQHSPFLRAQNLVEIDGAQLVWTTTVWYRNPVGRVLWNVAKTVHHRMVPYLLGRAYRAGPAT